MARKIHCDGCGKAENLPAEKSSVQGWWTAMMGLQGSSCNGLTPFVRHSDFCPQCSSAFSHLRPDFISKVNPENHAIEGG